MQSRSQVLLGLAFAAGAAAVTRAAARQRLTRAGGPLGDPASTVAPPEPITRIAIEGIDLDERSQRPAVLVAQTGRLSGR
jgi:hypothetical protein